MKTVKIADMTLRREAQSQTFSLSFKEKTQIARELDKLGVDVIELAPIVDKKADTLLVHTIAGLVKNSALACPVGMTIESIENTWNAVMNAARPRLVVSVPVSPVQMEYVCGLKAGKLLERIELLVGECAAICGDVEFCAEDATRAEPEFLCQAIEAAITAGATTITLCDTVGTAMPQEFAAFVSGLYESIPALANVAVAVQCTDDMNMACACAFACVDAGAEEIKVTVNGELTPALEAVAKVLRARGDSLGFANGIDMTGLNRAMVNMNRAITTERSTTSAFDNQIERTVLAGQELTLDKTADIGVVGKALATLGYDLSGDDLAKVYESFCRIAEKKQVSAKELDAIVAGSALQVPPTYKLISYVVNSGNIISATAHIRLEKDGRQLDGLTVGDGPVDAAMLAIEQIVGHHYELEDFQVQAVTEGREAMGSTLVKLRSNGKLFSGQGVSTDVIGATVLAYLDALNKIVYEESIR